MCQEMSVLVFFYIPIMAEICMHQTLCFLRCINEKFTGNDFLIFFLRARRLLDRKE